MWLLRWELYCNWKYYNRLTVSIHNFLWFLCSYIDGNVYQRANRPILISNSLGLSFISISLGEKADVNDKLIPLNCRNKPQFCEFRTNCIPLEWIISVNDAMQKSFHLPSLNSLLKWYDKSIAVLLTHGHFFRNEFFPSARCRCALLIYLTASWVMHNLSISTKINIATTCYF